MKGPGRLEPAKSMWVQITDRTFRFAENLLGDAESAWVYLNLRIMALENKTLLECLKSMGGYERLRTAWLRKRMDFLAGFVPKQFDLEDRCVERPRTLQAYRLPKPVAVVSKSRKPRSVARTRPGIPTNDCNAPRSVALFV
jgi:hypothetical protein